MTKLNIGLYWHRALDGTFYSIQSTKKDFALNYILVKMQENSPSNFVPREEIAHLEKTFEQYSDPVGVV